VTLNSSERTEEHDCWTGAGRAVLAGPAHCSGSRAGGDHGPSNREPRAPHPHELLHFVLLSFTTVHYRRTIELGEKRHAQGYPPPPPARPPQPPDALRKRASEGERESERIPALSTEKDGGGWTKTHCPWI